MAWKVNVPLADLLKEPTLPSPYFEMRNPTLETQLLYGERVQVLELKGEWAQVESAEQLRFRQDRQWHGYPGWILLKHLIEDDDSSEGVRLTVHAYQTALFSWPQRQPMGGTALFGARLVGMDLEDGFWKVRLANGQVAAVQAADVSREPAYAPARVMLARAMPFLGKPYFWGGCSPSLVTEGFPRSGVDCSGLTHLLHRTVGIDIPRDAHDQWLKSRKVKPAALSRGDLLFTAPSEKPDRMDHVLMYVSDDNFLEASLTAGLVRLVTLREKVGCSLLDLCAGKFPPHLAIHTGTFLN